MTNGLRDKNAEFCCHPILILPKMIGRQGTRRRDNPIPVGRAGSASGLQ
jgi:hypothetical protein